MEHHVYVWSLHLVKHAPPNKQNFCRHNFNSYHTSYSKLHLRMLLVCLCFSFLLVCSNKKASFTVLKLCLSTAINHGALTHTRTVSGSCNSIQWKSIIRVLVCICKCVFGGIHVCVFVKLLYLSKMSLCVWPYKHVLQYCALNQGKQTLLPTCITLQHLQYRNSGWYFVIRLIQGHQVSTVPIVVFIGHKYLYIIYKVLLCKSLSRNRNRILYL